MSLSKHLFSLVLACAICLLGGTSGLLAQRQKSVFKDIKIIPHTPVRNQGPSGTCWCFAVTSYLESEFMRAGNQKIELSEMFTVRHCLVDKMGKYIRMNGKIFLPEGGMESDVIWSIENYGVVPRADYGYLYATLHAAVAFSKLDSLKVGFTCPDKNPYMECFASIDWRLKVDALLDSCLGKMPQTCKYKGKKYTPQEFARDVLKFKASDYVALASDMNHPFYKEFCFESGDNWRWSMTYNVPCHELVEIADYALDNGYSFTLGADVSETYFYHEIGVAAYIDVPLNLVCDSKGRFDDDFSEKKVSPGGRQWLIDRRCTTDDHAMHVIGLAKSPHGKKYYKLKNSWGDTIANGGYIYMSKAYFEMKTTSMLIHKDAIPPRIRKKLNL